MDLQRKLMSRIVLAFCIGALLGVGIVFIEPVALWSGYRTTTQSTKVGTETVMYHEGARGYLARPLGTEQRPAIILIHEWWGLNDGIKALAEAFAQAGYVAFAVDLYGGKTTDDPMEANRLAMSVQEDPERALSNLRDSVAYLRQLDYVDADRLASVGWGFGGGWSYQMALNDFGTRASVVYYGQVDPTLDLSRMTSALLGHFGEDDMTIPIDAVHEFQIALGAAPGAHEVYLYPHAGQGFAVPDRANKEYNEEAADLAWSRTLEFLALTLERY